MKKNLTLFLLGVFTILCVAAIPTTLNTNQFNSTSPLSIKSGVVVSNLVNLGSSLTISNSGSANLILNETASGQSSSFQGRANMMRLTFPNIGTAVEIYTNRNAKFFGNITNSGDIVTSGISATNINLGGETRTNWPSIATSNILYVAKNGNDSTGNGTIGSPYLTIGKAKTNALSGWLIYCFPGVYDEIVGAVPQGVSLYLQNADIIYTGATGTNMIEFTNGVSKIYGNGILFNNSSVSDLGTSKTIYQSGGAVEIECSAILSSNGVAGGASIYQDDGTMHVKTKKIYSDYYAVWWGNGDLHVEFDDCSGMIACDVTNTPTGKLWVEGHHHVKTTGSCCQLVGSGGGTEARVWYDVTETEGGISSDGLYFYAKKSSKILGTIGIASGSAWINVGKLQPSGNTMVSINGGKLFLNFQDFQDPLNTNLVFLDYQGGTASISGQITAGTNSTKSIWFRPDGGFGVLRLDNLLINTVGSSGFPIFVEGHDATLVTSRCTFVSATNCIASADPQTIKNYGSVANITNSVDITVLVEPILVDPDVE